MTSVYKHRLYCNDEASWVYQWTENAITPITQCPNNSAHSVNANSESVIDQILANTMLIDDERTPMGYPPTGKNYRLVSHAFNAPGNQTTTTTFVLKYPTCIHAGFLITAPNQKGDILSIEGGKNTIIGVNTAAITNGDTVIAVSPTVITNIKIGRHISITDGTNTTPYIGVIGIDTNAGTITLESGCPYSFTPGRFIRFTIYVVQDVELGEAGEYRVGSRTVAATYIPANMVQTITYVNNSADAKRPVCIVEITY